MSKTNELRKIIATQLNSLTSYSLKGVFYQNADDGKMYPHIVYDLANMSLDSLYRDDYVLEVEIFDTDVKDVEDIADSVESLLHTENIPKTSILPTFYLESRKNVPDEDKHIKHIQLRFTIQLYER